jgi:hypothetical protein
MYAFHYGRRTGLDESLKGFGIRGYGRGLWTCGLEGQLLFLIEIWRREMTKVKVKAIKIERYPSCVSWNLVLVLFLFFSGIWRQLG